MAACLPAACLRPRGAKWPLIARGPAVGGLTVTAGGALAAVPVVPAPVIAVPVTAAGLAAGAR